VKGDEIPCNPCSECAFDPRRCNADTRCAFMPLTGECRRGSSKENGCVTDVLYGGVKFYKVGEEDNSAYGCKDGNVYEREGAKGSRICFKKKVGSMQRECSDEATDSLMQNTKFSGTVDRTVSGVDSPQLCARLCNFRRLAGFTYDTGEHSPTYEDCTLFSQITGQNFLVEFVSAYCLQPGDDTCISEAMHIGISHCGDDCEASEETCGTCISDKLEDNCSNKEELSLFGVDGEPWKCLYDVPKCVLQCLNSHNPFVVAECTIGCVPKECLQYVCDALGIKWPTAKQACICLPTLIPIGQKCRKDNPDNWPNTVECIIEQVSDGPCISLLCDLLKYLFPEAPEAVQVCNCAIPIISSVKKCHDQYGSDWVEVVECVAKVVGKDCKKYLCKYAGKIFPPILKVPFCKNPARLPY